MINGFEIATVQVSQDKSGFLGVQVDGLGTGAALATFPLHHAYGFRSRPRDPDANGDGCQALVAWEGGRGHCWLLEDPRLASALPASSAGGSTLFAVTATGTVAYLDISGSDGSAKLHVPSGASSIRLEYGDSGPSIEVNSTIVELGGSGGPAVVVDNGVLASYFGLLAAATGVPAPTGYTATKVHAL